MRPLLTGGGYSLMLDADLTQSARACSGQTASA